MLNLHNSHADMCIPDEVDIQTALERTTHLGISAHQDDLEILAFHGILECFGKNTAWFTGVVCTDGSGSPRSGIYGDYTDDAMTRVRQEEQRVAARIGRYSAVIQADYPSKAVKDPQDTRVEDDVYEILKATRPEVVYTHNPADKHTTHVAVVVAVLNAIRRLPVESRPKTVYGCEVWRDLDWMPDERKVVLDVGGRENLAATLLGVFDSQVGGGKRYDLAALARRRANATFLETHATDTYEAATYAIDITPLVHDDTLNIIDFVSELMQEFHHVVTRQLHQVSREGE